MRYLIDFSYSGENFNGYQKQKGLRTVQEDIENVLTSINNNIVVRLFSSGRTDSLVNALHQKAHFDLISNIDPYKLKGALNSYLKDDIYINDIISVDNDFHARYMVKSKTYVYKINTGIYNPLYRNFIYQYNKKLNIDDMKYAIKDFIGEHDFTSFVCSEDRRTDKVRTIFDAYINCKDNILSIYFKGNGFMKYQVRNMVGVLIKIGEGKLSKDCIPELLIKKDRTKSSICAPAQGLTLYNVEY